MDLKKNYYNPEFTSFIGLHYNEYKLSDIKKRLLHLYKYSKGYIFLTTDFINKVSTLIPNVKLSRKIRIGLLLTFIGKELILSNDKPDCYFYHYNDNPLSNEEIFEYLNDDYNSLIVFKHIQQSNEL